MESSRFFTILFIFLRCHCCLAGILPSIHWSTTNPAFKSSEVYTLNVLPSTSVNIICPTQAIVLSQVNQPLSIDELYENFMIVDKEGFDTCSYDASKNKTNKYLMSCDKPTGLKEYPLQFKTYSSTYGGLEFKAGTTYYFIATSDGTQSSLDSTSGGHCNSDGLQMKFKVYICTSTDDCIKRNKNSSDCPEVVSPTEAPPSRDQRKAGGSEESTSSWMPITVILIIIVVLLFLSAGGFLWKFSERLKKHEESSKDVVNAVTTMTRDRRDRDSHLLETLSQTSFNIHDLRSVSMYVSDPNMNGTLQKSDSRPQSIVSSPSQFYIPSNARDSQYTTNSAAGLLPYTSPKGMEV